MPKYDYAKKEKEIWEKWQAANLYHPALDSAKNPYYALYMFPYPSAEGLHVGHAFSATGADVHARYMRMKGSDVFQPMGFDAFGIHSENFALKIGDHPQKLIDRTTKRFREQFDSLGLSYDWSHSVNTSSPEYYKWTQWLFIQLFKAGLAEKKKAEVNWCPSCLTVLADEQVLSGHCERCNSLVERRELKQWFFKITDYADKLLEGLDRIDWSEKVKLAQRNWIGKSEGMLIEFPISNSQSSIEIFTTKPETADGATFLVVSPEHKILAQAINDDVKDYIERYKSDKKLGVDESKEKTGVNTGLLAVNPITGKEIAVWVSDYVLSTYGSGAIMAVPAQDERDREFAQRYQLPITSTSMTAKPEGKKTTHYHLRDWLISRQRYWGAPIPMVKCEKDGWQPVAESELPVKLPYVENFKPLGTGVAPLAQDPNFVNTTCPVCGGPAVRETDVSDTFLDSSWYFLRYPSTDFEDKAFDEARTKKWLPVNMYIGGAEHSVLHLLYARFVTKVLFDLKMLDFDEPFTKFRAHGLLIKDGAKMSKSRGNVVNPDEYIVKYGADTLRCYLMFLGPFDQGGDFRDSGIEGMERFLKRVRRLVEDNLAHSTSSGQLASKNQSGKKSSSNSSSVDLDKSMNRAVKDVGNDLDNLRYNTALSKIMIFVNDLTASKENIEQNQIENLVILLAPFAPFMTEELWEKLGHKGSIHEESWPEADEKVIVEEKANIAVQVNGKTRTVLTIDNLQLTNQAEIEKLAMEEPNVSKYLQGKTIKKVIYVQGKILNFVI